MSCSDLEQRCAIACATNRSVMCGSTLHMKQGALSQPLVIDTDSWKGPPHASADGQGQAISAQGGGGDPRNDATYRTTTLSKCVFYACSDRGSEFDGNTSFMYTTPCHRVNRWPNQTTWKRASALGLLRLAGHW
jgi:hypothetical protein